MATAGVEPRIMGYGPVPAVRRLLARTGVSLDEIDVIELNEAFAAQVLACLAEWKVDPTDERLNPNGSGISLGHPIGATGARILATAAYEARRRDAGRADAEIPFRPDHGHEIGPDLGRGRLLRSARPAARAPRKAA